MKGTMAKKKKGEGWKYKEQLVLRVKKSTRLEINM